MKALHQLHLYRLSGNNLAFYGLDVLNFLGAVGMIIPTTN